MTTPRGTATLASAFTYAAPPTIASVTPTKGRTAGGQTITVSGTNFLADTIVTLGTRLFGKPAEPLASERDLRMLIV